MTEDPLRWDPYYMKSGSGFVAFWERYLEERPRKSLYVIGSGFDPRMHVGLKAVLEAGGKGDRDCILIDFDEGPDSPSLRYKELVTANQGEVRGILKNRGKITHQTLKMWSGQGPGRRRVTAQSAAEIFPSQVSLTGYDDVVVDVSAMPRGVYFPLIGKVLSLADASKKAGWETFPNLFVVAAENPVLDRKIRDVGPDDSAGYIHGFGSSLEMESTAEKPRVWIPVLGESQHEQLRKIHTLVNPDEISPVVPNPAEDPRRDDELLVTYRELLFDEWRVETQNLIYASENNPFEVYRQIVRTAMDYDEALGALGGCKIAISAVSSKLLSVGAMLAAYELKSLDYESSFAHVEVQGYEYDEKDSQDEKDARTELRLMALYGDFYEK